MQDICSLKELAERPGKDAAPLCQVDPEASRIIDSLGPGQKESYLGHTQGQRSESFDPGLTVVSPNVPFCPVEYDRAHVYLMGRQLQGLQ